VASFASLFAQNQERRNAEPVGPERDPMLGRRMGTVDPRPTPQMDYSTSYAGSMGIPQDRVMDVYAAMEEPQRGGDYAPVSMEQPRQALNPGQFNPYRPPQMMMGAGMGPQQTSVGSLGGGSFLGMLGKRALQMGKDGWQNAKGMVNPQPDFKGMSQDQNYLDGMRADAAAGNPSAQRMQQQYDSWQRGQEQRSHSGGYGAMGMSKRSGSAVNPETTEPSGQPVRGGGQQNRGRGLFNRNKMFGGGPSKSVGTFPKATF
jgi:hypothetical protein